MIYIYIDNYEHICYIIYESLYYSLHVKHSAESITSSVTQAWGVFGHRHILTPWLGKDSCRPFGPLQYFPQKYALAAAWCQKCWIILTPAGLPPPKLLKVFWASSCLGAKLSRASWQCPIVGSRLELDFPLRDSSIGFLFCKHQQIQHLNCKATPSEHCKRASPQKVLALRG